MRNLDRALLTGSLGFAVAFAAGCGGGAGLLSGDQASTLQNQLSQISSALSSGRCGDVRTATESLAQAVQNLPASVNGNLRQALDQQTSQVTTLAVQECHTASTTRTSPATTTPTTPTTTQTTTTSTTTAPTTTQTTTPPTTTGTTPATTPTTSGTNTSGSSGGGGLPGSGGGAGASGNVNGNGNGNG